MPYDGPLARPLCNRVTPWGGIEADPARGLLTGNRGVLHDAEGRLGRARWRSPAWICCRLDFGDRARRLLRPKHWTELFFLDEATALAAGHRPCAFCRRAAFRAFALAWRAAGLAADGMAVRAPVIDRALHAARLTADRKAQQHWPARLGELPPGAMVTLAGEPRAAWLVVAGGLRRWSHGGYGARQAIAGAAGALVLTPAPTVAALLAGYRPLLHPTVDGS